MKPNTQIWLHRLFAAFIGGGAGAIVSGLTSMGIAPDKFNVTTLKGFLCVLGMMAANFIVSGILSAMFYLKQSPLPPETPVSQAQLPPNPNNPDRIV